MEKNHFKSVKRILVLGIFSCLFMGQALAQVTFLDSSIVTNDAFYYWKADVDKPYHYGASINPHGNCVKTSNGYVFYTWYRGGWNDRTLMVSRKKIGSGTWKHVELRWAGMTSDETGEVQGQLSLVGNLGDTHLTTNIGICPIDSTIHIMYDHHNENLNYIRSKKGLAFCSDDEFTQDAFLPQQNYLIPGEIVNGVSYPDLFNNDEGEMYFERRLGSAVGGNIIMTYYNGVEWSPESMIIQGTGTEVSQGERNFCYGSAHLFNGKFYYTYSPRWAESPTTLDEGVYLMELGARMNDKATNVAGRSYDLPIIDHAPFFIADPRSVPDNAGWAGGPQVAISPKNDIYLNITPKNTNQYNYLKKAGETEFTEYLNKGALGQFYGNRMYKFAESNGYLNVQSCLAGTYEWRTDYSLYVGARFNKSVKIMDNGTIVAVYSENMNSATVPIHCFVFKIEKSDYTSQTITFDAIAEKTEGDADFALSATATSNLSVVYTSSDEDIARIVEGNKVQIMGVGSCDIMANQAGDGIYATAPEVKQSLVVNANLSKTNQMIQFTLASNNYVWDSGDITLAATASSSLPVIYSSSDEEVAVIVGDKVQVKRAGTTVIKAMQMGNDTYNAAPIVDQELIVPKRKQEITFEALPELTSADPAFQLKATSNNPNAKLRFVMPNNQVGIVWSDYVTQVLGTGSATITVSDEGDDYYLPAQATQQMVVKSKTHVIPAAIEAEYYTSKSGVNVTRWSNSVFYLNSWGANDFAEYTIDVPKDTVCEVEIFAASPGTSKKLNIVSGTTILANVSLTVTPSLTVFKSSKANVALKQGVQKIKIVGVVGGYNFDRMNIVMSGGTVTPPDGGDTGGGVEVPDYVAQKDYTVTSSDGEQAPNLATNLFDGNITDDYRWSAQVYPKSVVIDLGEEREIIGARVFTYQSRAYQYTIEVSNDPSTGFTQVVDRSSNTSSAQPISDDFALLSGRYVKLTVTGCDAYSSNWVSINELALIFNDETANASVIKENAQSITLYPNPSHSSFNIVLNGINEAQVQIYNMSGQIVYNDLVSDKAINLEIGVYIVKVSDQNNKTYCEKLIIN